jgi:hypothetical protein
MSGEKSRARRLFFVDNLRVFLSVLVILHHLAIIYGGSGDFAYKEAYPDDLTSLILTLFTAINAPYFMGFWFLMAGYFAPGSYDRKGGESYVKGRLLRLGIPLLFYIAVIHPLLSYSLAAWVRGYDGSFWSYYVSHVAGYGQYGLGVGPMWFTAVLLIFVLLYGLWRRLARPAPSHQIEGTPPGNLAIAVFSLALALVTFVVRIWYPIDRWVTILLLGLEIAHMPQYISLFVLGILAYRRNWFLGISDRVGKLWLWVAVVCMVLLPIIFVVGGAMEGKVDVFKGGVHWQAAITALWESALCMGMIVGLLVLFRRRLDHQGPLAKAMAASSFAVYIIHQPVLIVLGLALRGVRLPHLLKFALVAPVSVALCFGIAHYLRKLPLVREIL